MRDWSASLGVSKIEDLDIKVSELRSIQIQSSAFASFRIVCGDGDGDIARRRR